MDFKKADLVCSDAVPLFIGDRFIDHMRSIYLNKFIIKFCDMGLRPGGNLLLKVVKGPSEDRLSNDLELRFKRLEQVSTQSTRGEASENFYLCHGFDQSEHEVAIKTKKLVKDAEDALENPVKMKEILRQMTDQQ